MKLQINTEEKTISIDQEVNFGELIDMLDNMFPNMSWKTYKLIPEKTLHNWINPITIPFTPYPAPSPWTIPQQPFTVRPYYSCGATSVNTLEGSSTITLKKDVPSTLTNSNTYNLIITKDEHS